MNPTPTLNHNLPLDELERIAVGPSRLELLGRRPPDLAEPLEAIKSLADLARRDPLAVEALGRVVQRTDWFQTVESALDAFVCVATPSQLQIALGHFVDTFWSAGEYGGGDANPRRALRIVDRLEVLGVPLEAQLPPAQNRRLLAMLGIGRHKPRPR